MKKIFLGLLVVVALVVLGLSYVGIVPILSKPFNKPKDLGVKVDKNLVYDFEKKYGYEDGSGKVSLDVELSSEEISSVFAVWEERDVNFPLKDVQVKFYPDGSAEASGILKLPVAVVLAKQLGYSESEIEQGKQYVEFVNGDLPFYLKGNGGMTNNEIRMNPTAFQIGKITVPDTIISPLKSLVTDMINRRIDQIGGVDVREASFTTGAFKLVGTVPSTIKY